MHMLATGWSWTLVSARRPRTPLRLVPAAPHAPAGIASCGRMAMGRVRAFAGASEAVAVACVQRLSARPTAGFRSCSASTFVELRISNENGKTNRCAQAPRYAGGGAHGGAPRKTGGWLVHAG